MLGGWNLADLPSQRGKVVVVTGANSGVGKYAALALAAAGAQVVMACRNIDRSQPALDELRAVNPATELLQLDVSDFDSIPGFTEQLATKVERVDVLVNNAGIMGGPRRSSAQGYELQMATNFLGHFALTSSLWPMLTAEPGARVVSLSSLAARQGVLNPEMTVQTLTDPANYVAYLVYANTKQAMLLFSQELARRVVVAGIGLTSVAAHPGVSSSNLFSRELRERGLGLLVPFTDAAMRVALQSAKAGALPTIRAAGDPTVPNGAFVGPRGLAQFRGDPKIIGLYGTGRNQHTAMRLWDLAEEITGYSLLSDV